MSGTRGPQAGTWAPGVRRHPAVWVVPLTCTLGASLRQALGRRTQSLVKCVRGPIRPACASLKHAAPVKPAGPFSLKGTRAPYVIQAVIFPYVPPGVLQG